MKRVKQTISERKGLEIAYGANGEAFIRSYKAMTQDLCQGQRQRKHREKQKVIVKGIFGEVVKYKCDNPSVTA